MLELATLAAFVPAVLVVVTAPGPDTLYTLTRSLDTGWVAGVAAATGTATGVLVHTVGAVLGLSAVLRTSAVAYTAVKYVGAAYLVYLGVRTLRDDGGFDLEGTTPTGRGATDDGESGPGDEAAADGRLPSGDGTAAGAYRTAVFVNVTNPKVAVFVLAFFPQFVPAGADAPVQLSLLGAVYAACSLGYLAAVALFAGRVRHLLVDSALAGRVVRYASGSVLLGFGLSLALEGRPGS